MHFKDKTRIMCNEVIGVTNDMDHVLEGAECAFIEHKEKKGWHLYGSQLDNFFYEKMINMEFEAYLKAKWSEAGSIQMMIANEATILTEEKRSILLHPSHFFMIA